MQIGKETENFPLLKFHNECKIQPTPKAVAASHEHICCPFPAHLYKGSGEMGLTWTLCSVKTTYFHSTFWRGENTPTI